MPYDLYGNHYASRRDAENAELAQMAEIDSRLAYDQVQLLQRQVEQMQQPTQEDDLVNQLLVRINSLEARIEKLEASSNNNYYKR